MKTTAQLPFAAGGNPLRTEAAWAMPFGAARLPASFGAANRRTGSTAA